MLDVGIERFIVCLGGNKENGVIDAPRWTFRRTASEIGYHGQMPVPIVGHLKNLVCPKSRDMTNLLSILATHFDR